MFERWCEKLVQMGKTHPGLRWPLVALLALLYSAGMLWAGAGALGTALFAVGRAAAKQLRETGGEIAGGLRRLHRWSRDHCLLAMARSRAVWNAARQWCSARISAAKMATRDIAARGKALCTDLARRMARGACRSVRAVCAEAPALRRHAPRRAMALGLTLCMVLSLLPVSAFATEAGECNHVHDENCYTRKLACGLEECEGHAHAGDCYMDALTCEKPEHVHDETCGALTSQEPETPECTCGALPDETGITVHAPGCPLYTAPEAVCGTCGEDHATADCPVEAARTLLAALPDPAEAAALMAKVEPTDEDYALIDQWAGQAQGAMDAYAALTEGQRALLSEAQSTLDALLAAFRGEAATLAAVAAEVPISSREDLKALADAINNKRTSLTVAEGTYAIAEGGAGTTFYLTGDVGYGDLRQDITATSSKHTIPEPIGKWDISADKSVPFAGVFDGRGHSIFNYCYDYTYYSKGDSPNTGAGYYGLFGLVSGTVKDLTVNGVYSEDLIFSVRTLGLIAYALPGATITNVVNRSDRMCLELGPSGIPSAPSGLGGIVGEVLLGWNGYGVDGNVTITGCKNYADIEGREETSAGGIVGLVSADAAYVNSRKLIMSNCLSTGRVLTYGYAGGIAGELKGPGEITNCGVMLADGSCIRSYEYAAGGIAGTAQSMGDSALAVTGCYSHTAYGGMVPNNQVNGYLAAGGIVGGAGAWTGAGSIAIQNCYSDLGVSAISPNGSSGDSDAGAGGVLGRASSTDVKIQYCYYAGYDYFNDWRNYSQSDVYGPAAGGILGRQSDRTLTLDHCVVFGNAIKGDAAAHRVAGQVPAGASLSNLYALDQIYINDTKVDGDGDPASCEGQTIPYGSTQDWSAWFSGSNAFVDGGEKITARALLPVLKDAPLYGPDAEYLHHAWAGQRPIITVKGLTVRFYDGSLLVESQTVPSGAHAAAPTLTGSVGLKLSGWSTKDGTAFDPETTAITEAIDLYAQWEEWEDPELYYTVDLQLNGGNLAGGEDLTAYRKTGRIQDITLPTPTREGYAFSHWSMYFDGVLFDGNDGVIYPASSGDLRAVARWVKTAELSFTDKGADSATGAVVHTELQRNENTIQDNTIDYVGYRLTASGDWLPKKSGFQIGAWKDRASGVEYPVDKWASFKADATLDPVWFLSSDCRCSITAPNVALHAAQLPEGQETATIQQSFDYTPAQWVQNGCLDNNYDLLKDQLETNITVTAGEKELTHRVEGGKLIIELPWEKDQDIYTVSVRVETVCHDRKAAFTGSFSVFAGELKSWADELTNQPAAENTDYTMDWNYYEPGAYARGGVVHIKTARGLAWLAATLNDRTITWLEYFNSAKWSVVLDNDVDLGDKLWTPIGTTYSGFAMASFDGQGHTISGLRVEATGVNDCYAGLFGFILGKRDSPVTIRNVTVTGSSVSRSYTSTEVEEKDNYISYVGGLAGETCYVVLDNCHVVLDKVTARVAANLFSSYYSNIAYVGGLVGYTGYNVSHTVGRNCSAVVKEVSGYCEQSGEVTGSLSVDANVGGLFGAAMSCPPSESHPYYWFRLQNCYAVTDTVIADTAGNVVESRNDRDATAFASGLIGRVNSSNGNYSHYSYRIENCYAKTGKLETTVPGGTSGSKTQARSGLCYFAGGPTQSDHTNYSQYIGGENLIVLKNCYANAPEDVESVTRYKPENENWTAYTTIDAGAFASDDGGATWKVGDVTLADKLTAYVPNMYLRTDEKNGFFTWQEDASVPAAFTGVTLDGGGSGGGETPTVKTEPAAALFSCNDVTETYNGEAHRATVTLAGETGPDAFTVYYKDAKGERVDYPIHAGTYQIWVSAEEDETYAAGEVNLEKTVTITQATPQMGEAGLILTYGQKVGDAPQGLFSTPGTLAWDQEGLAETFPDATETGTTCRATFTPANATDYTSVTVDIRITVAKAPLTAAVTVVEKVYDATETAPATVTLTGAVRGEKPAVEPVTVTFETADVGENKAIRVSGVVLAEEWRANYVLERVTYGMGTVTRREYGKEPDDGKQITINPIPDQFYRGEAIYPEPAIRFNRQDLKPGTDYELKYGTNTQVGEGAVTVTFLSNFTGKAELTFNILNAGLPEGTTNDNVFTLSGAELMKWYNKDIELTAKSGWTVGTRADALGGSVTLSVESTKDARGEILPSSAKLFVKDSEGQIYQTTVEYLLDKTIPTVTVEGMGEDGVNKIWADEKTITIHITDALSGVRYINIVGQDSTTMVEYGDLLFGYTPLPTDGTITYTVQANDVYTITLDDNADNRAAWSGELPTFVVEKIDREKPTATFGTITGTQGENGWFTGDITVNVNVEDPETIKDDPSTVAINESDKSGIKNWEYSLDGGKNWTEMAAEATSFIIDADGDYTDLLTLKATDNAGNVSEIATASAKLDKAALAAPTVTVKAGDADYDGNFTAKPVTLTATANGTAVSGVRLQYRLDSGKWADASTVTHSANTPDEGVVYTFRALSGAGTPSDEVEKTVKYRSLDVSVTDATGNKYNKGDLSIDSEGVKDGWHNHDITVTVTRKETITDGSASYPAETWYKVGDGGRVKLDGTVIQITRDGEHELEIWTEDASSNETTHLELTVKIDKTAPTITDVAGNPTSWSKADAAITFTAADKPSGVASVTVTCNDGQSVTHTDGGFTADRNGVYTITVTDKAGNTATETVEVKKIDKADPVVTWSERTARLSPDKWYGKTAIAAEATDDSGEAPAITLTASGKTYKNGARITETGSYTFYATAKDGAGNTDRSTALTVRIETLIDDFVAKVDGLNGDSDYQDILDAVNWYNGQSTTVKDRFSKSDDATAAYEKLMSLLREKGQEAANGVTDAIKKADTIDEIDQAAKDYDSLPDEARNQIPDDVKKELDQKKKDADAAQKVIEQLAGADREKVMDGGTVKDHGGSYEEKNAAQDAYDKLTPDQKTLVEQVSAAVEDKAHIGTDLSAIDHVLDLLKDIKKPYTPATKDQIKSAGDAYDALSQKQKDAFPRADKARLDALEEMRQHAQNVEDQITALGENPTQADLNTAKGAYDSLTADEKTMVDGALKEDLDKKYQDMLDRLTADEKAAVEFAAKVEETKNAPTVDKIEELIRDYDALTPGAEGHLSDQTRNDYKKLVDDLNKAKDVIDRLDGIDSENLTPDDMGDVKDALDGYNKLDGDQQKLVDEATNGKADILDEAVKGAEDATGKIEDIPSHKDGTEIGPDCPGYDGFGGPTDDNHDYEQHRKSIEEAKIAYERLTDAGRKLISDEAKETLNHEYAALITYLEYVNTAQTASTTVEVAGLAEKVRLPDEAASAGKTVVTVSMADSKPAVMPPTPAGKTEALSVDVKLVAKIYDDPHANEADTPIAQELVQPKDGEAVLVKLKVPTGYQNDTLELWHVKDSGGRSRIEDFWLVTEGGGTYVVFEVSSFSHFIFFAEKTPTGGGTVTPPAPRPEITDSAHGSTSVDPKQPRPGTTVTIKPEPDEGYVVDKVTVTDKYGKNLPVKDNGGGSYSYIQPNGKVTVTATFKPVGTRLLWNPFTDVKGGDWFYESVKYVYEHSLMNGTASDRFSPYLDTSRGMIVTILWRLEGEPEATAASSFSDAATDAYYAKAVAWGAESSIVKGYGNGNFGPNDPITREQLAAVLYRYAQYKGIETPTEGMAIGNFSDGGEVSGWARDAVRWCLSQGIISGKGNNILDSKGRATRAETAAILTRYLSN